jgi:hypothetical protein
MTRRYCRVCGDDTGTPDSSLCGRCCLLTIEERTALQRSLLHQVAAPIAPPVPVAIVPAAPPIAVDQVDQLEGLCPEQETRTALRQLETETETRLERIHRAARLELLLRPFPEWAFPQPR